MTKRFAFYGRISTVDKQDQSLARPSQLKASAAKAAALGGKVDCEFFDQESGAKDERPGWTALTQEARDRDHRRFDAVVIYQTSRLSRDRFLAGLYERELRKVGVPIHYAVGGGDPDTPEGMLAIGVQQLIDEFERKRLSRETKRGMRENALQGFRNGGRAPYGYRRELEAHPNAVRAENGEHKARLVPDPEQAEVVVEIFHLWAEQGLSCKRIADHLNRPGGPPSPAHVDRRRNQRGDWAKSTIRSMLKNPVYTGRLVWNRLDFATQRDVGGTARLRAREEWAVSEVEHLPLVSDELFQAAQERFKSRPRGQRGRQRRDYLFTGMVRCSSGHQPLAMYGRERKDKRYYCCDYGRSYGDEAAAQIPEHGKWLYLREDALLPLVERFFAERIFGPMRLDKLERQLRAHGRQAKRKAKDTQARLRGQVADLDRRIGLQIDALEKGVEPELIGQRIAELRAEKEEAEAALRELGPGSAEADPDELKDMLGRLPDLSKALHKAPLPLKRQVFEAFCLQIRYDRVERRIEISATVSQAVAKAFEKTKDLPEEVSRVTLRDIAGAGFEPATFGL
jgi:site-specific DNA recombinase